MPRFFLQDGSIGAQSVTISGGDTEHIRVLRLGVGDEITVCDGAGNDALCRISHIADGEVQADIIQPLPDSAEPSVACTILAGLPKGERADFIVQKCVELGAANIIFFLCKRCVARPDAKSMQKKLVRYQRIAESAAKQSGRGRIPQVSAVPSFEAALDIAEQADLMLFMYETGERITLREKIESVSSVRTAAIITGPEGGFEEYEVAQAVRRGMTPCAMGPRILRCETAPMAALTVLMYATDNL